MIKKRILFVDDEPNVVDGLRRLLRKQRQVWHMEFAQSGAEALAKLAEMPFDVLVTDIQMPGMNGAELLERVVQAYPGVARIVLSGHVDETVATRVVSLAHRFLAKPTDADTLIAAVERAGVAQQEIGDERVRAWIGSCRSLPSLPTLYVELMQAAHSDTTNAREIARIISRDMAISAKILQLVNSSFFGLARRISSVEQTVSLLGLVRIRALVLAEHVVRKLMPENAPSGLTINHLWSHSCAVAEVAHRISKLENQDNDRCDQAFIAGLLHDIGVLALATQGPAVFARLLAADEGLKSDFCARERALLGVTHGEIGAYLLELWGLPPRVVEAVRFHHEPGRSAYNGLCAVTCVHAADALVSELVPVARPQAVDLRFARLDVAYLERVGVADRCESWRQIATDFLQGIQQREEVLV